MTITPDIAEQWLDMSAEGNRPLDGWRALGYARCIRDGYWQPKKSESAIEFRDGRLVNGQHRLMAVLISGRPIEADVVGVPA